MSNILVVAAHPDDEILGCGGTLLKHRANGDNIFACIVTSAYEPAWSRDYIETKLKEAEKVDDILGTTKRFFCRLPTVKLNTVPTGEINLSLKKVIDEVDPDIIYTHHQFDVNKDHGLVNEAVMVNTRPIEKKIKVRCFETVSSSEWNNKPFIPNLYVDISGHLEDKIEMFCQYKSEVKEYPHPRSPEGLRVLASKRGIEICTHHAEAFEIARDFWT
jgi:LmbE family N-acetylglucosaminyl deacetylase